jgi:hypothetical protein
MDIALPGCAFEVHGPERAAQSRSATCNSDTLKAGVLKETRHAAGRAVPLRTDSWAAIVGAAVNRAYSTQV